jgi:hypothetical protein
MKRSLVLFFTIVILFSVYFPVQGQSQTEQLFDTWVNEGGYVHEQSFSTDYTLIGMMTQYSDFFHTGNWKISEAKLTLVFSTSQLIHWNSATLTISLNGDEIYSSLIPVTNGQRETLTIDLPIQSIIIDYANNLLFEADFRGDEDDDWEDDDTCDEEDYETSWINIFKESYVSVAYIPQAPCDTIAQFYRQFTSIDALENKKSTFCLPENAGTNEITAMATAATGISGNAVLAYENIAYCTANTFSEMDPYDYILYFSLYKNLLPQISAALSAEQKTSAEDGAVAALLHQGNRNILVITGKNEKALENAGYLLANAKYIRSIIGDTRKINENDDFLMRHESVEQYMQLTQIGEYVNGLFRQSIDYVIDYPENRTIASSSEIDLDFSYSENLDFNKSLITIYINDIPIGSKKLSREKASGDNLSVSIPDDQVVVGDFTITIAFDFSVLELWCKVEPDEIPWGFISNTSMLKIMSIDQSRLIFENYPSPFLRDGRLNNLVVVLPDNPQDADYQVMNKILITIGRFQKDNTGSVKVTFSSDPGDLSTANVISIGRWEKNKIAQGLTDKLFFRFTSENGNVSIQSDEKRLIDSSYGNTLGIGQIIESPYSEYLNGLVIISGITDEGMMNAANFLGISNNLWKIKGDVFVAISDKENISYYYSEDHSSDKPATYQSPSETPDLSGIMVIAGSLIILCLFGAAMIYAKYRKRD